MSTQRTQGSVIADTLMIYVKLDRAVMGTKFKNNPRSMAGTKKKIENNYHEAQGFALLPHSLLVLPYTAFFR